MAEDPGGTAKRRFERFDARDCHAEVAKAGLFGLGRKHDVGGPVLDMSDMGLRYLSAEKPSLGAAVKMLVRLGPIGSKVDLKGVVRWVTASADGKHVVGVEFENLKDEDRAQIHTLRDRLLNRSGHR